MKMTRQEYTEQLNRILGLDSDDGYTRLWKSYQQLERIELISKYKLLKKIN